MGTIRNLDQRDRLVQTMNKIKVLHSGARRALNEIINHGSLTVDELKVFLRMLCPFAPHLCEEMWEETGETSLCSLSAWPEYDEAKTIDSLIEIVIQINGKVKSRLNVSAEILASDAIAAAKADEKIAAGINGKQIIKEIYVPKKLVNIVVK